MATVPLFKTTEEITALFTQFLQSVSADTACRRITAQYRLCLQWELKNPDFTVIIDSRDGDFKAHLMEDKTETGEKIETEFETFHKWMIGAIHLMVVWNRRELRADSDAAAELFMALLPYFGRHYRATLNEFK
ncbi:MAG: hypothetical protein AB1546_12115 [bacterium]